MNQEQFKRIFSLIKRTGDRFVLLDTDFDEPFVVMDLENYEAIMNVVSEETEYDYPEYSDVFAGQPVAQTKIPSAVSAPIQHISSVHTSSTGQDLTNKTGSDIISVPIQEPVQAQAVKGSKESKGPMPIPRVSEVQDDKDANEQKSLNLEDSLGFAPEPV
jgi:hypothetical protein